MKTLLLFLGLTVSSFAQETPNWKLFIIAKSYEGAATTVDAVSGLRLDNDPRYYEANPVIRAGGLGTKFGLFAGTTVLEALVIRKYPRSAKWFSYVSFGSGTLYFVGAVHNFNLH